MNVLIDTSVWVDHFRESNTELIRLIELDIVLIHPMIVAELACGTPPAPRQQTLNSISVFRQSEQPTLQEVMYLIEHKKLYGLGCGLVDITVLASAIMTPNTKLWTFDKRLAELSKKFNVGYRQTLH